MTTLPENWHRDPELFQAEVDEHGSFREIQRRHNISQSTLSNWALKHGIKPTKIGGRDPQGPTRGKGPEVEPVGVRMKGDHATVTSDPRDEYDLGDIDALLRDRGLNPDDWQVERVTVNEWNAYAGRDPDGEPRLVKLRQLKVFLKKKASIEWLFPAVEVRERKRTKSTSRARVDQVAVICGDQQARYQDEELHEVFLKWLADVKPALGALTGDTMDLPSISRHADRPHWNAAPQECINEGYRLLSEYVDASPDTSWRKLRGNHDWRLESEMLTRAERMFGLTPAEIAGEEQMPLYSIRRFLHLDALGVELVGREGDKWELAEFELVPGSGVYVRHQPPNLKKLTRLHRSIVAGDTHRQSIKQVTTWHGDEPHVITLVETGCMCRIDGLGYVEHPDWQQGFATVALGADGSVGYDLAVWRDGVLTWRGETWK